MQLKSSWFSDYGAAIHEATEAVLPKIQDEYHDKFIVAIKEVIEKSQNKGYEGYQADTATVWIDTEVEGSHFELTASGGRTITLNYVINFL